MQSVEENTVTVAHLIWLPFGIELFKNFISSYKKYSSGYPHQLILLFNGVTNEADTKVYHELASQEKVPYKHFNKRSGFDLDMYFWIADKLTTKYVLYLNSYSTILSDNWLLKYVEAFQAGNAGMVAATASYSSIYSNIFLDNSWLWEKEKGFYHNYRKYKLLIKNVFLYSFYFKKFPNPHLRTNAFFIPVDLFKSLRHNTVKNKLQAYRLENGRNSISIQIKKMGYALLVMDKHGLTYEEKNWRQSKTFWINNQENLLIEDNQTKKYEDGDEQFKNYLTILAWGRNEKKI